MVIKNIKKTIIVGIIFLFFKIVPKGFILLKPNLIMTNFVSKKGMNLILEFKIQNVQKIKIFKLKKSESQY